MDVFLVADDVHAHQTIQQKRRLVRRGVVDDDHLQGVFRDRSQTRQCQLRAIEQYKEDGDLRALAVRNLKRESLRLEGSEDTGAGAQ